MNGRPINAARAICALVLCALSAAGCASWRAPRIDPTGQRIFLPPEAAVVPAAPIVAGVPAPQESVSLVPGEIIAPVGSEVILLAGVNQADGSLWPHQRVEWMLDERSTGQFVTLGDRDNWFLRLPRDTPRKLTNHFAIGSTSSSQFTITRGTADAGDDVTVQAGQAWISVTSPVEGSSRVTAYSPAVPSWRLRKATATIHWVDAQWVFPAPSITPVGARHVFTTTVSRHTNNTPLTGWIVRYRIIGGPPAGFAPEGAEVLEVPTDALGQASVEIFQKQPQAGTSRVGIEIIRPPQAGYERELILGTGTVTQTWTAPDIAINATGPARAGLGATATYQFAITNPGDLPARGVTLTSELPPGASLVSSNPPAEVAGGRLTWTLGDLAPRETRPVELNLRADQLGSLSVCASVRTAEGLTASDCASTVVASPSLEVQIRGPQTAVVGEDVRYEVTITNRGQVAATGLIITDTFDPGFRHMISGSPIERDLPDIEPGQSRTIYITFGVVAPGEQCHTVAVSGAAGVSASARACLTATAAPPPEQPPPAGQAEGAALQVTMTGPRQRRVGEIAEFSIDIRNTGEVPLTNLRIVDTYELALDPVQASGGFTRGREELVWQLDRLEPGKTYSLQVNCQCVAAVASACNRVTVYSDQRPPLADEACVEIFPPQESPSDITPPAGRPELSMSVADLNDPARVGQEVTYRVFVTNQGPTSVRNVQLSVTLPPELTPVPAGTSGPTRAVFDGQTIRFEPVAEMRAETNLRPADAVSFTIRARAASPGAARIQAELTGEGVQPIRVEETTHVLPGT
jgi:uncharacterized repeat protein (TIGR01451 family)